MKQLFALLGRSAATITFIGVTTTAYAQVSSNTSAGPTPFGSGATIEITVSAYWTYNYYICPSTCRPDHVEVDILGSDGYSDSRFEFAGSEHGMWFFYDSIPGGTMQATSYTTCVTVTWLDVEVYQYHSDTSCGGAWVEPARPTISGPNTVWWFNGENPSGYSTSIDLSSDGGWSTQWSIVAGWDKVTLSTTQGEYVTLTSTQRSHNLSDVQVTATVNGITSSPFAVTVRAPNSLEWIGDENNCDSTYGYLTKLRYLIRDQFTGYLEADVPTNERWASAVDDVWVGNNWRRGPEGSDLSNGPLLEDQVGGEDYRLPPFPAPGCSVADNLVEQWEQEFWIGTLAIGSGVRVQRHMLQKRLDFAEHDR